MRSLEECSGPWTGRWTQGCNVGVETVSITLQHGKIAGEGSDRDGEFRFDGTYGACSAVVLTKTYTHAVRLVPISMTYVGVWNGLFIAGTWSDDHSQTNSGDFELWPSSHEMAIGSQGETDKQAAVEVHGASASSSPSTAELIYELLSQRADPRTKDNASLLTRSIINHLAGQAGVDRLEQAFGCIPVIDALQLVQDYIAISKVDTEGLRFVNSVCGPYYVADDFEDCQDYEGDSFE